MNESIYEKRQHNLNNVLQEKGLDGILITNLTNIRYICGFTGSAASCLVTPKENTLSLMDATLSNQRRRLKALKYLLI